MTSMIKIAEDGSTLHKYQIWRLHRRHEDAKRMKRGKEVGNMMTVIMRMVITIIIMTIFDLEEVLELFHV